MGKAQIDHLEELIRAVNLVWTGRCSKVPDDLQWHEIAASYARGIDRPVEQACFPSYVDQQHNRPLTIMRPPAQPSPLRTNHTNHIQARASTSDYHSASSPSPSAPPHIHSHWLPLQPPPQHRHALSPHDLTLHQAHTRSLQ